MRHWPSASAKCPNPATHASLDESSFNPAPVACGVLGIDAIDFGVVLGGECEQGRDREVRERKQTRPLIKNEVILVLLLPYTTSVAKFGNRP